MTDPSPKFWSDAESAVEAGDTSRLSQILKDNPLLRHTKPRSAWCGGLTPDYSSGDSQSIMAREHHFESWTEFVEHQRSLTNPATAASRFEAAVDAVVTGKLAMIEDFLRRHPELILARSARKHSSTLLHYIGANGVEGWRQRTPPNAIEIAQALLRAGAEVNSTAKMYGGSTTLGLVATSIHPAQAGVQNQLIDLLLDHGARIDHPEAAGNGQTVVNGCLANGRPGAAAHLALRGAALDLEAACGVGHLEVVQRYFAPDGSLVDPRDTPASLSGLKWAAQYGQIAVARFLATTRLDLNTVHQGQTALHWAAYGGHAEIVRLLLGRGADARIREHQWHKTALGWALYGWERPPSGTNTAGSYYEIVRSLVEAGAPVEVVWLTDSKISQDHALLAALKATP